MATLTRTQGLRLRDEVSLYWSLPLLPPLVVAPLPPYPESGGLREGRGIAMALSSEVSVRECVDFGIAPAAVGYGFLKLIRFFFFLELAAVSALDYWIGGTKPVILISLFILRLIRRKMPRSVLRSKPNLYPIFVIFFLLGAGKDQRGNDLSLTLFTAT